TKLLSAPVSNKIEAYRLFRRNVPVTTLDSGFVPARPTAYTLAGALFLPPWLPCLAAADELSPTSYLGPRAISNLFRGGLGGGAGANMGEGGDSIGGSGGKGICGGGEDQGDNVDAGGEDIARSLTTPESVYAGIGTGAGIEILVVVRYA
nr:hypothetical protein [Tanacetum cinerariifolium]